MANESTDQGKKGEEFVSRLSSGRERFLAHVIEHGLEIRRRTAEDFIRHFPPAAIMNGLENQAGLRSQILVLATGVKQKIAMKKSAQSAGEDLQIALDEGETDAETIVTLFHPDDRVRYLDAKKIWAYVVEGEFWTTTAAKREDFERAKSHLAFMLDRALTDKLLNHRDIVDGISVAELSTRLAKDKLGKIIQQALTSGRQKEPFTDVELLTAMPPTSIVDYVPLDHIWQNVVVPKIAKAHKYVDDSGATVKEALDWLDGNGNKAGVAKDDEKADKTEAESADNVEVTDDDIRIS
jgi:hypothetical protein